MTPASQARAHEAGHAAGAHVTDPDEVQALLLDIFARTGQKVQADDPLVAAALIHSALLRRAGQDAALAINEAAHSASQGSEGRHRCAAELQRAMGWPGLWQAQLMLGTALFVLCFLASMLGNLLAGTRCH